ncbi:hypothetical protein Goshw_009855 [Gossypium schwendimanii]|uniref:DUF4283 domain-containing protein n=1 Tax=Gossypium schwendimanii TaxID=34291 RepID=A0A7J9MS55_GOSSC|nr:hypothetical protein [Gossypium schwendimanii]
MANLNMVEVNLANLNIMDEEEDPLVVVRDDISADPEYGLCLVGRVFTDRIMNFPSLKNTLANLWYPLRGVSIMDIEYKHILFQFYSEIDLKRVMDGMPWFFNQHLIVFHRLIKGKGDETELEDIPVEFMDGKKRQRFNVEVGGSDNRRRLLDGGLENAISTAAAK